jgi:hypothetical protein
VFPPEVKKVLEEAKREHDALLDGLLVGPPETDPTPTDASLAGE